MRCRVQIRNAIPKNISHRRSEQKRPLVYGKGRNRFQAEKLRRVLLPLIGMAGDKLVKVYPRLPGNGYILALILTNFAAFDGALTVVIRGPQVLHSVIIVSPDLIRNALSMAERGFARPKHPYLPHLHLQDVTEVSMAIKITGWIRT